MEPSPNNAIVRTEGPGVPPGPLPLHRGFEGEQAGIG
jgi:hypothetical protein